MLISRNLNHISGSKNADLWLRASISFRNVSEDLTERATAPSDFLNSAVTSRLFLAFYILVWCTKSNQYVGGSFCPFLLILYLFNYLFIVSRIKNYFPGVNVVTWICWLNDITLLYTCLACYSLPKISNCYFVERLHLSFLNYVSNILI